MKTLPTGNSSPSNTFLKIIINYKDFVKIIMGKNEGEYNFSE